MARSPLPSQAPRQSLVDTAIDLIRNQIESGAWGLGERIPREQELADAMHIGRNTVREAIRVLSYANVLEVRQGDGTYVRSSIDPAEVMRRVNRASLQDHFELRAMLETEAARLAAAHRSEADLALLFDLLDKRGQQHDHDTRGAFVDADLEFHNAVARMSGNTALAELYRYFSSKVGQNTLSVLEHHDLPEPGHDAHAAIVEAIARGDGEAAGKAAHAVVAPLIEALSLDRGASRSAPQHGGEPASARSS